MKEPNTGIHKKTWLIAACSVVAVILAGALLAAVLNNSAPEQIADPTKTTETVSNEASTNVTEPSTTEENIALDNDLIHILLIGQNAETSAQWNKSDAMILCTINKNAKTLTMTSFLRSMYVEIPGHGGNMINECYALGGMELLDACLEQNFGIVVDANVTVNFSGLLKLIDMAGGVKLQLTDAEAKCLNQYGNWGITNNSAWTLKAGENSLTAEQVMGYARLQSLGGEMERTARQRKVLSALVENAKSMSATQLYDLVKEGLAMISTDMTEEQILGLVVELAPIMAELEIVTQRIPVDGSYEIKEMEKMGSCAVIDLEANRQFLADTLNDE